MEYISDSKVHGVNMGPTWVLSSQDGPHVGPMNLGMRDVILVIIYSECNNRLHGSVQAVGMPLVVAGIGLKISSTTTTMCTLAETTRHLRYYLYSKVYGANMGPIWGRQDPGGPHVGPIIFAIWVWIIEYIVNIFTDKQSGRSPKVVALFPTTNFSGYIIELLQLHDTI